MRKTLIALMMAGLLTCSGCASLDALMGRHDVMHGKLSALEQQIDEVSTGWKNVEGMTADQKAELVDQTVAARQQTEQVQKDLKDMGTAGIVAGGAYLAIRHVLPRVGGPLGTILSLALNALIRKREDDGTDTA